MREVGLSRVLKVPAELEQLRAIRGFVEEAARAAGLSEERIFDVRVAASEACASALEHGPVAETLAVHVRHEEGTLVLDFLHPGAFSICPPSPGSENGLGIPLMIALADDVTIARRQGAGVRVSLSFLLPFPA
jgi:serine/threonine-protein kinase RsbW